MNKRIAEILNEANDDALGSKTIKNWKSIDSPERQQAGMRIHASISVESVCELLSRLHVLE